jgi:nitrogen fixation protein FixH
MPTEWFLKESRPATESESPAPLTGGKVLAMLVGFFVVVALVNALMMTLAIRTMPGLDARNGYDPSQRWNAEIAAARAQRDRGWRQSATVALAEGAAEVVVSLTGPDGGAVSGLDVDIRLAHPATRQLDRQEAAVEIAPGRYRARLPDIRPGQWTLSVTARDMPDGEPVWRERERLAVKG